MCYARYIAQLLTFLKGCRMGFPAMDSEGFRIDDEWLTTAEAVEFSGIPRTRFRSWAQDGRGPVHRRVPGSESLLWLRSSIVTMLAV